MTTKPVLITTTHRGVFFGDIASEDDANIETLVVTNCRNAIYWAGKRGFLGLATHGPSQDSKIGSTAVRVVLHNITSIADCTQEAATIWRDWP